MPFWSLFLIAVGVSADAFAVAVGRGLGMRRLAVRTALTIAVAFGIFQGLMPLLGWLVGTQVASWVTSIDHWVAFGLLAAIGARMIYMALTRPADEAPDADLSWRELFVLSVATSIDALAVGIGFAFLDVAILGAVALFTLTTAVIAFIGVLVGQRAGARFRGPAEVVGGLILIAIGVRILLDHLGVL